jgi:integral membrane protein
MINKIRFLRYIGIAEGISFLVLLLIAMPLKYYFGWPMAVKVVGWMHGILFITYIVAVLLAVKAMKWNWISVGLALVASLIPIATFLLDRSWKRREAAVENERRNRSFL